MKKKILALTLLVLLLSLTFTACAPAVAEERAETAIEVQESVVEEEEAVVVEEEPTQEPTESAPTEQKVDSRMAFMTALEGFWTMTYPYDPQCTETMTFNSDMTFAIDAGEEHIEGMYGLDEKINENGRATFWMLFTSDNGGADCSGSTSDNSGMGGEFYIEFSGPSELQFFMQASGGEAQIIYNR